MAHVDQTKEELIRELEAARARIAELEKEASEREERFQAFMDNSPAIAWAKDEEGRYIYLNQAVKNRFQTRFNWRGKTDAELWPAAVAEKFRRNDLAVLESGRTMEVVEETVNPGGRIRYWWNFKFPFQDSSGRRYIGGIGVEITERKKAEEALKATEKQLREQAARLQATLDAAPVVILSARDNECREIFGNRFARELAGVPEGTNMSRTGPSPGFNWPFRLFKDGLEMRAEDLPIQRVSASGRELRNYSYDWVFDNGDVRTMFGNIVPTFDSDGRPNGAVAALMNITERKRMEEVLQQSQEQIHQQLTELESIYHSAPVGLCVFDRELRYVRINQRLADMNGVPIIDHIGKTVREIVPDLAPLAEEIAEKILRTGEAVLDIEFSGTTEFQPGVQRYWIEHWLPLKGADGEVFGINVVVNEVTEQRHSEQALRRSERGLAEAQRVAHMGSWEWNLQTGEMHWSEEMYRVFGQDPMTYVPTPEGNLAIVHPDDRETVRELRNLITSGCTRISVDYRILLSDGSVRILHSEANVTDFDVSGKPVRLVGMIHDITERKQAEEALKKALSEAERQKRQLEAVMEALPVGVAIVDKHGGIIRSNSEYERIWGGNHGKSIPPVGAVKDYAAFQAWWADSDKLVRPEEWGAAQAVQKAETVFGQLLEIRRFDGSHGFVLNSAAPIRDAGGKILGAAVAIQDITELRRTQDALRESEEKYRRLAKSLKKTVKEQVEQLQQAENLAAIGRMVAIVAHEIRNPLLNIQLGVDTFCTTLSDSKENTEILAELEYGLHQLNGTVNELLEYARAVRLEPVMQPVGPMVSRVLKNLLYRFDSVVAEVTLENEKREIFADTSKITRALTNIVLNAAEAMPQGGALKVESRLSGPNRLCLSITDTGRGMNSEAMKRLFQPFYTTKTTGTGLGLAISRKIVEAHNGRLTIQSKMNKGTTVKIYLPLGLPKASRKGGDSGAVQ
ncbi:MAG: PAS domain S-box protein [Candidatus Abyssobacteria bacterium SURF_5]|uniref:histidine kinase n=1 Tax=Abyssobacteria bacterium (strain SURF_5) TaxID=2093360 RepID=A0A3A4NJF3_ABYX5|nr:MAG: PAS domain S-box protein [Candidatus Abyssubacteria bacterium SURF_5]